MDTVGSYGAAETINDKYTIALPSVFIFYCVFEPYTGAWTSVVHMEACSQPDFAELIDRGNIL